MTVKELIKKLHGFPPDHPVTVMDGFQMPEIEEAQEVRLQSIMLYIGHTLKKTETVFIGAI